MKYKVEIVKYRTETVTAYLDVTEMDENQLEGLLDELEDYRYSPQEVAIQLAQRLPGVLSVEFDKSERYAGIESEYEKVSRTHTAD